MPTSYKIHPAIGVARVGDSTEAFYVAPERIGGLPTEFDAGSPNSARAVQHFKDAAGRVRRQAARFQLFRYDDAHPDGVPVALGGGEVASVEWRVHLANKKAAWWNFDELVGDNMLGPDNSYEAQGASLRNASVTGRPARQALIIDPGPRTVSVPGASAEFDAKSVPPGYAHASFPPADLQPATVTTLGGLRMANDGSLLVLGGYGHSGGGKAQITTFAGADGWYDDIADGPVAARVTLASGEVLELDAWCVVGSPKFAPELSNISTLDDVIFDTAVRFKGLVPALWDDKTGYQDGYVANFERDIQPIFERMKGYRWVSNVDAMVSFATPGFDIADASEANRPNRERWFSYLRNPGDGRVPPEMAPSHQQAFASNGFPLMPLNSGSNSVSNVNISKFVALDPTQYFLLKQWAAGRFATGDAPPIPGVNALDRASAGNCVGYPMCPGIEVTWTTRNPVLYVNGDPYRVLRETGVDYAASGLDPARDETQGGGCQPGDLTKRMAIPWQADFFDCSVQEININDPAVNQLNDIPVPPTFFAYWWPAQSPWDVYTGALNAAEQALDGATAAGQKVNYHRGINTFDQTTTAWKYLGFILNAVEGPDRVRYPYFVERERNYANFSQGQVAVDGDGKLYTTQIAETVTEAQLASLNLNVQPVLFAD